MNGMLRLSPELQTRAELRFFGRTLEPRFRRNIEQIAIGNRVILFFGEVDHRECLSQMAACDVILIPSRDDALSFVGLDALSLGKTLVCSRTTGVSEYLQDGRSALILHENTPEEIGQFLARAITDAELRVALGQGARAVYERTFTVPRFAGESQGCARTRATRPTNRQGGCTAPEINAIVTGARRAITGSPA